jgi:hypothetical protein
MRTLAALAVVFALPAFGQAPAPASPPAAPAAAPAAAADEEAPRTEDELKEEALKETEPQAGQYQYLPAGRRDPFVSLLRNIGPSAVPAVRPPGMAGFLIQELALKGIVKDRTGYIAMLLGTDGKSYFARVGDRLYDGLITAMDGASVTFRQDVTDPLSPVKTRDVRKSLYAEEARQ